MNPPTSLFEAAQRGMKMEPTPQMAVSKTEREWAKQLVEAVYELPRAEAALQSAKNRLERFQEEFRQSQKELKKSPFKEPRAILVKTQFVTKIVLIRMDDAKGIVVEVLDVEDA